MSSDATRRPSFAARHPRLVAWLVALWLAVNTARLVVGVVHEGPAAWFYYGSGLVLALLLTARPWQLWTRRDVPPSLSRSAPRWPRPDPSPFRRTRRGGRAASETDPR